MVDKIQTLPTFYKAYDWSFGPDKLFPAESKIASKLSEAVILRSTELDLKKYPPISIYSLFKKTVELRPDHNALVYKVNQNSPWLKFSYSEYWKMCFKAAKSFIKLGLEINECVGIIGFNAPQWFIAQLGANFAGGIGCGIYPSNKADSCEFILKDSNCQIVVVENKEQLDKILICRTNFTIKKIIQYTGKIENNYDGLVMNWSEFIDYGSNIDDLVVNLRVKTIAPNKCASLIYTSGTTGNPKAAMISHDNITYLIRYIGLEIAQLKYYSERFLSYLPLSHIAAQVLDIYAPLCFGITVYFAQPDALKGTLNITMKEIRPTFFFGVPRVWEKMQENIEKKLKNLSGIKLDLFKWAQKISSQQICLQFSNSANFSPSFEIAKILVINKIIYELGLDKCRSFYSGAAPITKETLDFFISIGIPLCEVYGMSESTGPHSLGVSNVNRVCSVGLIRQCNRSKINGKDDQGSGELAINGRHIFMGYLNNRDKTNEVFDDNEWLCTGDIAKIDDNFLYITGRLKEIIITAGGENVAPIPIEDNIKSELPNLVSNCLLIGDKRKYLVVLVTLKCKFNMDSMTPTDDLTTDCIEYVKKLGSTSTKVSDILNNKDNLVYNAIEKGIKRANEKSISRAAKVQKFQILPRDFSLANGELGPTLKLRRPIVYKMYNEVINELYEDKNNSE